MLSQFLLIVAAFHSRSTLPDATPSQAFPGQFTYSDAKGNLKVVAHSGSGVQTKEGSYSFTLKGAVSVRSISQGLGLDGDEVVCDLVKGKASDSELRHAVATGKVHLTKTIAAHGSEPRRQTDIRCAKADLLAEPHADILHLSGPVEMQTAEPGKPPTMVVSGQSGVANLAPRAKGGDSDALRSASLDGPVKVTMLLAPSATITAGSKIVATGDHLDVVNGGMHPTVVLRGHVEIHGEGTQSVGKFTGLNRATLRLDATGKVVGWEMGS